MNLDRAIARAKRIEDAIRERAFLPIGETINGVDVLQFSLRHCTICFKIRSPFFYGTIPQVEDVGMFLWIVSPHYDPDDLEKRRIFLGQVGQHDRWALFYPTIRKYINRAFMDRPPTVSDSKPIATSFAAGMIHKIASAYGWTPNQILDTPIAALFQLLKWIDVERNYKTPQFNPIQDRIMAKAMNGR